MTDRELLELAAKAAQLNKPIWIDYERAISYMSDSLRPSVKFWNPLTDDGDALRLAVKLGLQLTLGTYNTQESKAYHPVCGEIVEHRHYQQDMDAATRRAIVRAAASLQDPRLE